MNYSDTVGNLFDLPKDEYLFAHCIAADLKWCGGIAPILIKKEFNAEYQCRYEDDNGEVTGHLEVGSILPVTCEKGMFVNLITKENTYDKPTYQDLSQSLEELKFYMLDNGLNKLAMPRIGSGIDGLDWPTVEMIIQANFEDTDIEIAIKHFE